MFTIRNEHGDAPIVLNVPHASTHVPSETRDQFILSDSALREEIRLLTDWHTDFIYDPFLNVGATMLVSNVSRFVVDTERFEDDAHELLSARGMGAVYTHGTHRQPIRRPLKVAEREQLLSRFYRPYHAALSRLVDERISRFGYCLVIDCHSYPSDVLPYEPDQSLARPEICIGTNGALQTPPWLVDTFARHARNAGYSVGLDQPFAGAVVPLHLLNDPRALSVMLEIKRSTYLKADLSTLAPEAEQLKACITAIAAGLPPLLKKHTTREQGASWSQPSQR